MRLCRFCRLAVYLRVRPGDLWLGVRHSRDWLGPGLVVHEIALGVVPGVQVCMRWFRRVRG